MKTIVCLLIILLFSFAITAQAQIQYEVNQPARIPTPYTKKQFVDPNHYFPGDLSRGQAVDPPMASIPEEQNNLSRGTTILYGRTKQESCLRTIHKRPVSQTEGMTNEDYQAWRNFIGSDLFGTKGSDQQKRIRREVK